MRMHTTPVAKMLGGALLTLVFVILTVGVALAVEVDPTGEATIKAKPEAAVNFAWTLVCAFLVFCMQLGFALLEAGLTRSKNTVNYLTKRYDDVGQYLRGAGAENR